VRFWAYHWQLGTAWHGEGPKHLAYTERDFFQFSGGSSEPATRRKYALAYLCAQSFPSLMSSTDSDGAIQVFPVTLKTEAWTPLGVRSENSRKCSVPTITSAQRPSSNMETPREVNLKTQSISEPLSFDRVLIQATTIDYRVQHRCAWSNPLVILSELHPRRYRRRARTSLGRRME